MACRDCSHPLTLVFPNCHSAPLLSYRRSNWAQLSLVSTGGASFRSSTLYLAEEEAGTGTSVSVAEEEEEEQVGGVAQGGAGNLPGTEVLEGPPDREPGAPDPDRLQHAGVSELVQHQRLVEEVGHLQAQK